MLYTARRTADRISSGAVSLNPPLRPYRKHQPLMGETLNILLTLVNAERNAATTTTSSSLFANNCAFGEDICDEQKSTVSLLKAMAGSHHVAVLCM